MYGRALMIVVEDYRHHRIESNAVPAGDRFNAEVRIRKILTGENATVEVISCFKVSATLSEQAGERWAKRRVDLALSKG
jgi:hypothetical protein